MGKVVVMGVDKAVVEGVDEAAAKSKDEVVEDVGALEAQEEIALKGVDKEVVKGVVLGLVGLYNLYQDQPCPSL